MSLSDQFLLALQTYQEIKTELRRKEPGSSAIQENSQPTASPAIAFPPGFLLLGSADEDGSPVLLDLYDPTPGPLLVAGDGGSGKAAFLQSLAYTSNFQEYSEVQFGALTLFPEEWTTLEALSNCLGVWPAYHPSARDFLAQMVNWAEVLPETRQIVLVLFDGLDLMAANNLQCLSDLRWLLTYGPERQIWPVVSVNPGRMSHLRAWLDYFHTRILGQVKKERHARKLIADFTVNPADLMPGKQFGLSRQGSWLKFWLPPFR